MKMTENKVDKPTILVTDTDRGSAVSIIRSLGRRGWRVIAADCNPKSIGFQSRYVSDHFIYPSPETSPQEFLSVLFEAVQQKGIDLIIPVTDNAIFPLMEARDRFERLCRLAIPDTKAMETVVNKSKTMLLAESLNVPIPKTYTVYTVQEACDKVHDLGWPVVLKPQVSRLYRDKAMIESFNVCYANSLEQIKERMVFFEGRCAVLLQEYFTGEGQGVELLMFEGRPLAAFQHRRLREHPVSGGASAFRESMAVNQELYNYSIQLLDKLKWTGLAMVEFKIAQGRAKLMEINGRVWGSLPLAVHSGMDFPHRLAELYLYGPPDPEVAADMRYSIGVRSRDLELELRWISTALSGKRKYPFLPVPGRLQGLKVLSGLFCPACKFDVLSLEDMRPGFAEISKIIRLFVAKINKNLLNKS